MKKYLLINSILFLFFISCNQNKKQESDYHAYHNPIVQPFTDAIEDAPDNPELYYQRAEALERVNSENLALKDLQKAVSLNDHNPKYIESLGILYLNMGQSQKAIIALQKNLKIKGVGIREQLLLTNAFLQNGSIVNAENEINAVLMKAPDLPEALYWKAKIQMAQSDSIGAIQTLKKGLSIEPKFYKASYQLANWYAAQNNDEAIQQYQKTFQLDTMNIDPLFEIGEFFRKENNIQQAKAAYHTCILKSPDYSKAYLEIGKLLFLQDSFQKALRQFILTIKTSPANAEAYLNKGLCFEKLNQNDSAQNAFRQALIFKPRLVEAQEGLNRIK